MKYRVDVFVNDEFFGDENNITHIKKEFETIEECCIFADTWKDAESIFILEEKFNGLFDVIKQII